MSDSPKKLRRVRLKLLWRRWYVKAVVATVMVLALLVVWNGTRHTLNEDQAIALAQGVYARASSCKSSLATTANPPAIWLGETWTVTVAGPCGLKTLIVYDATGEVRSAPTPTPTPRPNTMPPCPPVFDGMVLLGGAPAPAGSKLYAEVGTYRSSPATITENAQFFGLVSPFERKFIGQTIYFTYQGVRAQETARFIECQQQRGLVLHFPAPPVGAR